MEDMMERKMNRIEEIMENRIVRMEELFERKLETLERSYERRISKIEEENELERIKYKMDMEKLEQFSRRDNIIVDGIKEKDNETTEDMIGYITEFCTAMDVNILKESIGDIHRIGKRTTGKNRRILLKTNRLTKSKIMEGKKKLRRNERIKASANFESDLFVCDDLTNTRRKLLADAKACPAVDFCFTRDGVIRCKRKDGRFVSIETPHDLFHLGADSVDYKLYYSSR